MATYDLTQNIPTKFVAGDILNCPYSGAAISLSLPKGIYKFECWGAQGGDNKNGALGGCGGYSVGTLTLAQPTTAYLYAGQKGPDTNGARNVLSATAFNGGGSGAVGNHTNKNGSGGGGSDIRIGQDSLYARIIVAGGGGGAGSGSVSCPGGIGGGISGNRGYYRESTTDTQYAGQGGTQTAGGACGTTSSSAGSPGTFGVGGSVKSSSMTAGGGGGGWYGGGSATTYAAGGGGGSGYVYTSSTASNYPSGCLLDSSVYLTDAQTIAGSTSFPSTSGSTETGHKGNGYVRITVIKASSGLPIKMKVNGEIVEASAGYVKVNGTWKEIQDVYYKNNNTWNN